MLHLTDDIIAYENGELEHDEVVALFQSLLSSGLIFSLQGSYQRTAQQLIDSGDITHTALVRR